MLVDVSYLRDLAAVLVGAVDRELVDEPSDRDVRSQLPDDPEVAERAGGRLLDAALAEEVVAARRLDGIFEYVEADRAQPPVVRQAASGEVRELHPVLVVRALRRFDRGL